jgi:DNA-binding MarR family transcriptional regulator
MPTNGRNRRKTGVDKGETLGAHGNSLITDRIVDAVWEIWRNSRTITRQVNKDNITPEQFWILRFLYKSGPHRIKDIASQLGTTSSPVTIVIKRLERDKVVTRKRSSRDEREVEVSLTELGERVFEEWRQTRRKALSSLFDSLDAREKTVLQILLGKVVKAMHASNETFAVSPQP